RHTRCYRDWSSDVCSSDLAQRQDGEEEQERVGPEASFEAQDERERLVDHVGEDRPEQDESVVDPDRRTRGEEPRQAKPDSEMAEIGRASCRERGKGAG